MNCHSFKQKITLDRIRFQREPIQLELLDKLENLICRDDREIFISFYRKFPDVFGISMRVLYAEI